MIGRRAPEKRARNPSEGDGMKRLFALAVVCALAVVVVGTGSAITGPKVIRVVEAGGTEANLDSEGEPGVGDRFYATNALYSWAGTKRGKRIGRDEVMCTFTAVHFERGWASVFCTAQFFLPGGSVSAQAFLRFTDGPQKFRVPVTGGTGVYANASGWIAIRDIGPGESGNSALTFHLQP
jgi:Allene oxide cyclase barrel like domain